MAKIDQEKLHVTQAMVSAPPKRSLVQKMAEKFGVEPTKMLSTLKATAFRVRDGEVTNEQMMALLVVADQYGLNPWTKEIYAFPDKQNGIVPVIGIDGWSRMINAHDQFDGMEFRASVTVVPPDAHGKDCPEWIECLMYRKDRSHPTVVREYLDEVYRPPYQGQRGTVMGPWQTHTKRMLRHKAMIQAARIAFGYVGIYDEDEANRIIEGQVEVVVEDGSKSAAEIAAGISKAGVNGQAETTAGKPAESQPSPPEDREPGSDDEIGEDEDEATKRAFGEGA